jgi:phenylacetate-CoA ligase
MTTHSTDLSSRRYNGSILASLRQVRNQFNGYAPTRRFLTASDSWDAGKLAQWQLTQMNSLLADAARHVPGYRKKFAIAGLHLGRPLAHLDEIRELPFFSKEELRADADFFTDERVPAPARFAITSGGTTGTPTRFFVRRRTYQGTFDAWCHAMWARAGFRPGARCLNLTWAFEENAPLITYPKTQQIYLSINHLNANAVETWLSRVEAFSPEFIIGMPSSATAFAKLVFNRTRFPDLRAIVLGAELLTGDQRVTLEKIFGVRVFCWYGMSEMAGFASACEKKDAFHFWPQSGVIEIIGDDGSPVTQPGCAGEVVLTGFTNHITPFIRYRTGDRAILGEPCQGCGRPHVVLAALEGRQCDFLLGHTGRMVPLSALNFHSDEFRRVFAHQFVQTEPGTALLRIVPMPGFGESDETAIAKLMQNKIGLDLVLHIEIAAAVERTMRGKQPLIIQRCQSPKVLTHL